MSQALCCTTWVAVEASGLVLALEKFTVRGRKETHKYTEEADRWCPA